MASSVLPWGCKGKGVALLTAYFDESGTHANSPAILISGVIARAEDYKKMEEDWFALLQKFELTTFHASHCENRLKEFEKYDDKQRGFISNAFTDIICKHNPKVINSVIAREDWMRSSIVVKEHFKSPYAICFDHCMQQLSRWSREALDGEEIALVFGEQQQYEPPAQKVFEMYKNSKVWGAPLVSLTFASMARFTALQAADLLAYETYQYAKELQRTKHPKLRPNYKKMVDSGIGAIGADYDGAVFSKLAYPDRTSKGPQAQ